MTRTPLLAGAGLATFVVALGLAAATSFAPATARAVVDPAPSPIRVDDFMLADQDYLAHQLSRSSDAKAIVLVAYAAGSKRIQQDAPALKGLHAAYADKGVEVYLIDSVPGETRATVAKATSAADLKLPVLFDYDQLVGEQLGVTRAGEVIVVEPSTRKIVYRGPLGAKGERWAETAVAGLVAGRAPAASRRPADGELLTFPEREKAAGFANISYTRTIAPIVQQKCVTCHQPGGIGPMALTNYDKIKAFSPMIREVVRTKRMPPYLADPTVGHFTDDDRLSSQQIKTLVHWIEAGAPRGAGEDPLAKISFKAPDWPLGKPDIIVEVPPVEIAANGIMEYQRPVVKSVMTEGRWMKATTFRVSDRKVVHHILTGVVSGDGGEKKTASETEWGASLGGYGPGRGSNISPPDMGTWVPPSGGVAFQNHYTPYGKPTVEKTQMGLYFYPKGQEPKYVMRTMGVFDASIVIPAGAEAHREVAYLEFPKEALIYGITPHAHVRGSSVNVSVRHPDGREEMLIALPRYDFNWQYEYFLKTPYKVEPGDKVISRWVYDNSKRNPGNPDPTHVVTWGEQTSEEMLATYLHYRWTDETVKNQKPENDKALQASTMMGIYDDNFDGKIEKAELKGKAGEMLKTFWAMVDKNKDNYVDREELAAAMKLMPKRRGGQQSADGAMPPAAPASSTSAGSH